MFVFVIFLTATCIVASSANDVDLSLRSASIEKSDVRQEISLDRKSSFSQIGPYYLSSVDFPWYAAKIYCESAGKQLASIETPQQNYEILGLLASAGAGQAWTAGTDEGFETQFIWITTGLPFDFQDWITGSTPRADSTRNCVFIGTSEFWGGKAGWYADSCTKSLRFVCE